MTKIVLSIGVAALLLSTSSFAQEGAAAPARRARPAKPPSGPTPRLADGKVDLGNEAGIWKPIWVQDWADTRWVEKKVEVPFQPWAKKRYDIRRANNSKNDPEGFCLPPGVPRYTGTPYPFQIFQMKDRVVILYEGASKDYRTVYTDGRKHSADPNPSWYGESIGWWEGDTFVVDTIGFNGRTWLDYVGHPTTEKLHVIEKYTRPNYDTLHYEATIDDPGAYTAPWTTSFNVPFGKGEEILEYVCLENNKDLAHIGATTPDFYGPGEESKQ
jgi:hypothetical protein